MQDGKRRKGACMKTWQKYAAEAYGTFVLVGIGTGTILAVGFAQNPGILAVSLAFGFALIAARTPLGACPAAISIRRSRLRCSSTSGSM